MICFSAYKVLGLSTPALFRPRIKGRFLLTDEATVALTIRQVMAMLASVAFCMAFSKQSLFAEQTSSDLQI